MMQNAVTAIIHLSPGINFSIFYKFVFRFGKDSALRRMKPNPFARHEGVLSSIQVKRTKGCAAGGILKHEKVPSER